MKQQKKPVHYVDNKKFYQAILDYKKAVAEHREKKLNTEEPKIPDYIGECIYKIAHHLSTKPCFVSYSFRDEMIEDGIENCFHRSTEIMTIEHGPIAIEKIVGKTVTVKSRDGIWRPAIVKSYGKQKLYEYGFGAFNVKKDFVYQKVIATANHRWFISARTNKRGLLDRKNTTITDLRVGDYLEKTTHVDTMDSTAVLHGILFGDGTGHKKFVYTDPAIVEQGTRYAFIRVCKQDRVRDEIVGYLESAGYTCTYPEHANGDPIFYIGKFPFVKDVPFTNDPSYIAGFIHGWWLADGNKTTYSKRKQISSVNEDAINWLVKYAAYGGYHVTSIRKKTYRESGYPNAKPLFIITLAPVEDYSPKVRYVEYFGEDEVFCLEEPITRGFVLANGLLTGNCFLYFHNYDPEYTGEKSVGPNPFAYFSQIIYFAFLRRIGEEERKRYMLYKNFFNVIGPNYDSMVIVDSDNKPLLTRQMYDNIAAFMERFEKKEQEKKNKRKQVKVGLDKFYEERDEQ